MSTAAENSACCDTSTCCGGVHSTARPAESSAALTEVVPEKYGEAAKRAAAGSRSTCGCGTACCGDGQDSRDPIHS